MSDLRTAALRALEAMEYITKPLCMCWDGCENCDPAKAPDIEAAITALKAALAEPVTPPEAQTEAEKVAYCAGWWDALAKKREQK